MKHLILCALLTSCGTYVGPRGFVTYGNARNVTYAKTGPDTFTFHADYLDHATATRAAGSLIGTTMTGAAAVAARFVIPH